MNKIMLRPFVARTELNVYGPRQPSSFSKMVSWVSVLAILFLCSGCHVYNIKREFCTTDPEHNRDAKPCEQSPDRH